MIVVRGPDRFAVHDQADEERRAADVGGDDVAVAELLAERNRADDPTGEHRPDRADRGRRRLARGDRTAVALHHQQRTDEPLRTQPAFENTQVLPQPRTDLRAHDRRRVAGELPDPRAHLAGQGDEDVRVDLVDQLPEPPLVHRVLERPQQGHRDRANPSASRRMTCRRPESSSSGTMTLPSRSIPLDTSSACRFGIRPWYLLWPSTFCNSSGDDRGSGPRRS